MFIGPKVGFWRQLVKELTPCVYGLLLGRGSAYSCWLQQLRQSAVPPHAGKARRVRHSHLAPGHRARGLGHPGVSERLLPRLCYVLPWATISRTRRQSPSGNAVSVTTTCTGGRVPSLSWASCNHSPAALDTARSKCARQRCVALPSHNEHGRDFRWHIATKRRGLTSPPERNLLTVCLYTPAPRAALWIVEVPTS
jgi:hypothetical protein